MPVLDEGEGGEGGEVPQDRRDAHIVITRSKETQSNNYRGISFLSIIIIIIIIIITMMMMMMMMMMIITTTITIIM